MPSRKKLQELQQLFKTHQRQLYFAAISITKNRASAEDAVHDALLAVAEIATEPLDLKAYVFKTVRTKALHCNKHSSRFEPQNKASEEAFFELTDCSPEAKVLATQVFRKIEMLESNQQQVLIMKLFADLTFEEIAAITETSINTVASWYRRGLEKLKESLHEPELERKHRSICQ